LLENKSENEFWAGWQTLKTTSVPAFFPTGTENPDVLSASGTGFFATKNPG
jgi:hypothetical protein